MGIQFFHSCWFPVRTLICVIGDWLQSEMNKKCSISYHCIPLWFKVKDLGSGCPLVSDNFCNDNMTHMTSLLSNWPGVCEIRQCLHLSQALFLILHTATCVTFQLSAIP